MTQISEIPARNYSFLPRRITERAAEDPISAFRCLPGDRAGHTSNQNRISCRCVSGNVHTKHKGQAARQAWAGHEAQAGKDHRSENSLRRQNITDSKTSVPVPNLSEIRTPPDQVRVCKGLWNSWEKVDLATWLLVYSTKENHLAILISSQVHHAHSLAKEACSSPSLCVRNIWSKLIAMLLFLKLSHR